MEHFITGCAGYFEALAWEVTNRARQTVPDLDEYLHRRRHIGAMPPTFALDEIVEGMVLPDEVREHPDVRRLSRIAGNLVCWANDILSGPKEIKHGEVHNFVLLVRYHHRCSLQEAVDFVAAAHDETMREFVALAERSPSFPSDQARALSEYTSMLQHWIRANLDWSLETARYPSYKALALS